MLICKSISFKGCSSKPLLFAFPSHPPPFAPSDFTILLPPVPQFSSLFQGLESICKYFQDRVQMNPPMHFKGILQYISTPMSLTPYVLIAP